VGRTQRGILITIALTYRISGKCNDELWKADFEADVLHRENQTKLTAKRLRRKMCCCKKRRAVSKAENKYLLPSFYFNNELIEKRR
jgi:hypothetical protein